MGNKGIPFLFITVIFAFVSFAHAELVPSKYRKITKDEKTKEEVGNCIFSVKAAMPKGEEDKYAVTETVTCGQYENIFVRCFSPKVFKEYEPDETQYYAKPSFGDAWMWNSLAHQTKGEYLDWDAFRTEFYGSDSGFKWMYEETPKASWHCDRAKKEGLKEFNMIFVVKVLKKVGVDTKTEWDDVQKAYITKEIPKYGEGKDIIKSTLKVVVPDDYKPKVTK